MQLHEFQKTLPFPMDGFQEEACTAIAQGRSVLLCAPTGAGKTVVGAYALYAALTGGTKAFYTTPIKALSNQKFAELVEEYGEDKVGLLTGDRSINGEAPIVVMTTEVLRNMLYAESPTLTELSHVVMDEVHYLADRSRGGVWEEVLIHLSQDVKLVALSATVSNSDEFAEWLRTVRGEVDVVVTTHRPVPLQHHMMVGKDIVPMFERPQSRKVNRDLMHLTHPKRPRKLTQPPRYAQMTQLLDREGLTPAITFIFSRQGCERAVDACRLGGVRLTQSSEAKAIRRFVLDRCQDISAADKKVLGFNDWLDGLTRGVAAHHAGIVPPFKRIVEELFEQGKIRMVFATETLALGVNMPAKAVVIDKLVKFNGTAHVELTPGEFTQLTGRAGRRGLDTVGHAVVLYRPDMDPRDVARLASNTSFPLKSSFSPTYNMAVNLADTMGLEQARVVLESSFAQYQADLSVLSLATNVQEMNEALEGYDEAGDKAQAEGDNSGAQRWRDRASHLRAERRAALKKIDRRTGSIVRTFDRLIDVLVAMEYLTEDGEKLTERGEMLKTVYSETDLLIAECLRRGVWDQLDPQGLAAIASSLVFNARSDDAPKNPDTGATKVLLAWTVMSDVIDEIHTAERAYKVPLLREPHPGAVAAMLAWAHGDDLDTVLAGHNLTAGDFVRLVRQTIDVIEQIREVHEPLRRTARRALDLIDRGVVAIGLHA